MLDGFTAGCYHLVTREAVYMGMGGWKVMDNDKKNKNCFDPHQKDIQIKMVINHGSAPIITLVDPRIAQLFSDNLLN